MSIEQKLFYSILIALNRVKFVSFYNSRSVKGTKHGGGGEATSGVFKLAC